jgi:hypothetical protein
MDMRFGMWNVGSLCKIGSLKTVASKLAKRKLVVQEVGWDRGYCKPPNRYTFFL